MKEIFNYIDSVNPLTLLIVMIIIYLIFNLIIRTKKVECHFGWQIGLMLSFGKTYMNEKYLCFELPFIYIQFILKDKIWM